MSKHEIGNETQYNAGIPDLSGEKINAIYAAAGLDPVTGLPVAKSTSGKVALASAKLSAGVLSFDAPMWAIIKSAKACNCMSCNGAYVNVLIAAGWQKRAMKFSKDEQRQSAENTKYFIQRLREIVLSASIKHNVK